MLSVSLLLTTYNCKANLRRTLEAIRVQDYPAVEVVIKDGGSSDGTLEVAQEFKAWCASSGRFSCVLASGPDEGLYDAMNQAYGLSSGDIIAVCNDLLTRPDAISLMVKAISSADYVGAHSDLVYATDEKVVRYWRMGQGNLRFGWMPGHPTLYLKREIYEKYGLYKTSYRSAADYEFMVRFLKDKENKLAYVPEILIRMFYGGTSTSGLSSYLVSLKEGQRALVENGVHPAWVIDCLRTARVLLQFLIRPKNFPSI